MKKLAIFLIVVFSVGLFTWVLQITAQKISTPFPGYLTFENQMVGAFYVPDWSGAQEGLRYHDLPQPSNTKWTDFSARDYVLTCVIPAVSGLLFLLLGIGLCLYFPSSPGRRALMAFHILVGIYLILTPDFHLTHQVSYVLLVCFSLIPATIVHFALYFPEEHRLIQNKPWLKIVPYLMTAAVLPFYIGWFFEPQRWVMAEYFFFFYLIGAYLFWIGRLAQASKHPRLESNRIIARYLLLGQMVAFSIPLVAGLAIFIFNYPFPLNFAAPVTILFPFSLLMGVILARLKQSQMQLVQTEKSAALGTLLAGLAHEINNPMTFIYSAIEPLKESLDRIQSNSAESKKDWDTVRDLMSAIEEGVNRSKEIIGNFKFFSNVSGQEYKPELIADILDQSIRFTKPLWVHRIEIQKHFTPDLKIRCISSELGQIFVNLIANACQAIDNKGWISVSTSLESGMLMVKIKDSGRGMPKEIIHKIFDPFFTTKAPGEGTGLGLAIVLKTVKKYGGRIDVVSELNKGTEFLVSFPIKGVNL